MSRKRKQQPQSFGPDILAMVGIVAVLAFFWWMGTSPEQAKQLLGSEQDMAPLWQRAAIVAVVFPVIYWVFNKVHGR